MISTSELDRSGAKEASSTKESASAILARFLAGLRFESLPPAVVRRTEEAFLDWFACTLAGRGARPVRILEQFAATMGPSDGPSEILVSRRRTSPLFAGLVNGAASHIVELDDVHNGALFHPGIIVFPAAFAAAQQVGASGRDFITGAVVGYEAAIRAGEFLGPAHYKVFHTTGTAGTLGAAAGVARILGLDARKMQHALGSAGTQAAGLWEFLRDAADSKPLHSAKASADGLLSAYIAREGFTGASQILEGKQGMAAGMSSGTDPAKLTDGLGESWRILGSSCKLLACCRHTHPSADALLVLMRETHLTADDIVHITAHVHHGAIDVLGAVNQPETVHQSKFSMGFVLGLIAVYGKAGLDEFTEAALHDPKLRAFQSRVEMVLDPEIDRAPGNYWGGFVEVRTRDGRCLTGRVAAAKGDPQNALDRSELEAKAKHLAAYAGAATPEEMDRIISRAWALRDAVDLRELFLGS
jgi:2-methylcitrate dehydratase PrpD